MDSSLPALRHKIGLGAALWAGPDGVRFEPGRWLALSGGPVPDFNIIFCEQADLLEDSAGQLEAGRRPSVMILAGDAVAHAERLSALGWRRVGDTPLMVLDAEGAPGPPSAPEARLLTAAELPRAQQVVGDVFSYGSYASLALPETVLTVPGQELWGVFDADGGLDACVASVEAEDALVIWSLATPTDRRRRGHGARVMRSLHAVARERKLTPLLYSSELGEPFYLALGYRILERWEMWSRPRWVLPADPS